MKRLTFYDRTRIEYYLNFKQLSLRDIAKLIGKNHTVLVREVSRHKPQLSPYSAELAQVAADRKSHMTNTKKLDKYWQLKRYVKGMLEQDWSPEQISGRLKKHPPPELKQLLSKTLCMETIYQYVYNTGDLDQTGKALYHHLRRSHKTRKIRGKRVKNKILIPDRVSIHERASIIDSKERYGDLEADLLEGRRKKGGAVSVHYERKGHFVSLQKVESKHAKETTEALRRTIESLPVSFVKSITFDNGTETARHNDIRDQYLIPTYHCDPYKPYQKGGVENVNGLIRQYIPKKTNMETIDQSYLNEIQNRLNTRPRKTLNYLTPNEVLDNVIKQRVVH